MKKLSKHRTGVGNISTVCFSDVKRDKGDPRESLTNFYMKEQDIPEYLEGCGLTTCTTADMPEAVEVLRNSKEHHPKEKKLSSASLSTSDTKKTVTVKHPESNKPKPTAKKFKPIQVGFQFSFYLIFKFQITIFKI